MIDTKNTAPHFTSPRIIELMRTLGDDVDARLGPDAPVPSGDLNEFNYLEVPIFRPQFNFSEKSNPSEGYSPWSLRHRLFKEYFANDRTRSKRIDGIHLSRQLANLWISCSLMEMGSHEYNDTVYGWPAFMKEVKTEGRIFRKWCKDEAAMNAVLKRGLVAAHNGLQLNNFKGHKSLNFTFIEGTFLANPEDDPVLSEHHPFQHYVDFRLIGSTSVIKFGNHKYVLPGLARVHADYVNQLLVSTNYSLTPSDMESPVVGCARMFGTSFPEPFTPVNVVDYGVATVSASMAAGAAIVMSPIF